MVPRDATGPQGFDPAQRYVRLQQVRADGFVEFEFALGDPDLAVDLILPAAAFRAFCRDHHAQLVSPLEGAAIDGARRRWYAPEGGDET
jgi:phenol/toluene 2-monooxygenase (NADH) P0/A0